MKIINKRAKRDYQIFEEIETGLVLSGGEAKSLRDGRGTLSKAFARIKDGEVWLHNFVIPAYAQADNRSYDPTRPRKLLLHKQQILGLMHRMEGKELTLVPLACYTTGRYFKIKLGLGRGRREYEKREVKKKREQEREAAKYLKRKI